MKYLMLLIFTITQFSVLLAGTNDDKTIKIEKDKKAAIEHMDEELNNFDTETDEEAARSLKKKKEKKKEKKNTADTQEIASPQNTAPQHDPVSQPVTTNNNQNEENTTQEEEKTPRAFRLTFTAGNIYFLSKIDKHPSENISVEALIHNYKSESLFHSGLAFGIGYVKLDYDEIYVSIAYSGLLMFISNNWGPFLRLDLGTLFWDDDIAKTDEEIKKDGDTPPRFVGLHLKGGAGFLLGNEDNGLSIQMLYTLQATTRGTNKGLELQLGIHF